MEALERLITRLEGRTATVGLVGVGYVGLPAALAFARAGFRVVGVDTDVEKVEALRRGESFLHDVESSEVRELVTRGSFVPSSTYDDLREADVIIICVPTPITEGTPDLSLVVAAGTAVNNVLAPGSLVILESTTYPGTTQELLQPLLEVQGRKAGEDFFLAFSPERIDPGNPTFSFSDIPKLVGGVTDASTRAAEVLYQQVVPKVVTVSTPREAELAKLIENTFRHVNIALINELAVYAHEMGINIWEAIDAAASKPFGYMPFWPSPGWGGHCIPLDPAFLSWKVKQGRAHEVRFVELAHAVNSEMARYVVERATLLLNDVGRPVRGSKILGVGMAYKGGTEDTRGSAGAKILGDLAKRGAEVCYHDPLVPEMSVAGSELRSVDLDAELVREQDLVLTFVPQSEVDWSLLAAESRQVFDCCNVMKDRGGAVERL